MSKISKKLLSAGSPLGTSLEGKRAGLKLTLSFLTAAFGVSACNGDINKDEPKVSDRIENKCHADEDGLKQCSRGKLVICDDEKWEMEEECDNGCDGTTKCRTDKKKKLDPADFSSKTGVDNIPVTTEVKKNEIRIKRGGITLTEKQALGIRDKDIKLKLKQEADNKDRIAKKKIGIIKEARDKIVWPLILSILAMFSALSGYALWGDKKRRQILMANRRAIQLTGIDMEIGLIELDNPDSPECLEEAADPDLCYHGLSINRSGDLFEQLEGGVAIRTEPLNGSEIHNVIFDMAQEWGVLPEDIDGYNDTDLWNDVLVRLQGCYNASYNCANGSLRSNNYTFVAIRKLVKDTRNSYVRTGEAPECEDSDDTDSDDDNPPEMPAFTIGMVVDTINLLSDDVTLERKTFDSITSAVVTGLMAQDEGFLHAGDEATKEALYDYIGGQVGLIRRFNQVRPYFPEVTDEIFNDILKRALDDGDATSASEDDDIIFSLRYELIQIDGFEKFNASEREKALLLYAGGKKELVDRFKEFYESNNVESEIMIAFKRIVTADGFDDSDSGVELVMRLPDEIAAELGVSAVEVGGELVCNDIDSENIKEVIARCRQETIDDNPDIDGPKEITYDKFRDAVMDLAPEVSATNPGLESAIVAKLLLMPDVVELFDTPDEIREALSRLTDGDLIAAFNVLRPPVVVTVTDAQFNDAVESLGEEALSLCGIALFKRVALTINGLGSSGIRTCDIEAALSDDLGIDPTNIDARVMEVRGSESDDDTPDTNRILNIDLDKFKETIRALDPGCESLEGDELLECVANKVISMCSEFAHMSTAEMIVQLCNQSVNSNNIKEIVRSYRN